MRPSVSLHVLLPACPHFLIPSYLAFTSQLLLKCVILPSGNSVLSTTPTPLFRLCPFSFSATFETVESLIHLDLSWDSSLSPLLCLPLHVSLLCVQLLQLFLQYGWPVNNVVWSTPVRYYKDFFSSVNTAVLYNQGLLNLWMWNPEYGGTTYREGRLQVIQVIIKMDF